MNTNNKKIKHPLRLVCCGAVLTILLLSSGCTVYLNGDFCDIYLPVYPDYEKDTSETIRQIDQNNIVYQRCF